MIDLITGVPGSGKTYYAVNSIYDLITSKNKKYKHIFTNINGLDYKKANDLAGTEDYVKSFEFIDLKSDMETEYLYHMESKEPSKLLDELVEPKKIIPFDIYTTLSDEQKTKVDEDYDKELLEYNDRKKTIQDNIKAQEDLKKDYDAHVKSQGVYDIYQDSLVIIDECHLYFESREDDVLIRFLSYHRHFNIDLYLITQNKNLINKKYLSFVESMYIAYPASKRLFSSKFRYKKFASYQEYHGNIMGTSSLKLSKKVFDLYSSGSNVIGKSNLSKMLVPILVLIVLASGGFLLLQNSISPDEPINTNRINHSISDTNNTIKETRKQTIIHEDINDDNINSSLFLATCFTDSCIFKSIGTSFKRDSLFKLINEYDCKVIINDDVDINYKTYVLRCNSNFEEFLTLFKNSEKKHAKNTNRTTGTNKPFSF